MSAELNRIVDVLDENSLDFSKLESLSTINLMGKTADLVDNKILIEKSTKGFIIYVDNNPKYLVQKKSDIDGFVLLLEKEKSDNIFTSEKTDLLKLEASIDKNPSTMAILEGTEFKNKVGDKFEKIGNKVEKTVLKYLEGLFGTEFYAENKGILDQMFGSWNTGIQFLMIEAIGNMKDSDATASFFEGFGKTNFSKASSAFTGLFKVFNQGNEFVALAKKVENCCQFLAKNKESLVKSQSPLFRNPFLFKEMMLDSTWNDKNQLVGKKLSDISIDVENENGSLETINLADPAKNPTENILSDVQKSKLQLLADDENVLKNMNNDLLINLAKDGGAVDKALEFLGKRSGYQKNISGLYETVQGVFEIEMFGMKAKDLLGVESIDEYLSNDEHKGLRMIIDFILGLLGFSGGFDGLKTSYQNEKLSELVKKNDFVKNGLSIYQNKFIGDKTLSTDPGSTFKVLKLGDTTDQLTNEQVSAMVPQNYKLLQDTFITALEKDPVVSPDLSSFDSSLDNYMKTNRDGVVRIPKKYRVKFSKKYLDTFVNELLLNEDLVKDIASSEDPQAAFVIALLGTVQAGKLFLDAHSLWNLDEFDYDSDKRTANDVDMTITSNEVIETESDNKEWDEVKEKLKSKKLSEMTFEEAKQFAYIVWGKGPATELMITKSKEKPSLIIRATALGYHENLLKFGKENQALIEDSKTGELVRNENSGYDIGTFQIHGKNKEAAKKKYNKSINTGIDLYNGSQNTDINNLNASQKDLFAWFGHVKERNGRDENAGINLFSMLADSDLSEANLKHLMHKKIQGGVAAIGDKVVANIELSADKYFKQSDLSSSLDSSLLRDEVLA